MHTLIGNTPLLASTRSSIVTRAKATKFTLKKSAPNQAVMDDAKSRAKIASMFERYGKILQYGHIKKPERTPEELEKAKHMTLNRARKLREQEFKKHAAETLYIKMRELAFEELPSDALKKAALIDDETLFPPQFIWALTEPPLESVPIFGNILGEVEADFRR